MADTKYPFAAVPDTTGWAQVTRDNILLVGGDVYSSDLIATRVFPILCGEDLDKNEAVYVASDGKLYKASANAGRCPAIGVMLDDYLEDEDGIVVFEGEITDDSWTWTMGGVIYLSETPGVLTQSPPASNKQVLGYASSATTVVLTGKLYVTGLGTTTTTSTSTTTTTTA